MFFNNFIQSKATAGFCKSLKILIPARGLDVTMLEINELSEV